MIITNWKHAFRGWHGFRLETVSDKCHFVIYPELRLDLHWLQIVYLRSKSKMHIESALNIHRVKWNAILKTWCRSDTNTCSIDFLLSSNKVPSQTLVSTVHSVDRVSLFDGDSDRQTSDTFNGCCPSDIPIITLHIYKRQSRNICDVLSEKGPYCKTNSVILNQLFVHFCDSIFDWNCTWSNNNVFFIVWARISYM